MLVFQQDVWRLEMKHTGVSKLEVATRPPRSNTALVWMHFKRHRLGVAGLAFVIAVVLVAILAPVLSPYDPYQVNMDLRDAPPSLDHLLGTDGVGRDTLSRLIYGSRISVSVGLIATTFSVGIAILLGSAAGYWQKWVDGLLGRFQEVVSCFPSFLFIITIVAMLGPSIFNVMFVIGLLGWTGKFRIVRGQFIALRNLDYVLAARAMGARDSRIIFRHVLPGVIPYLIVGATFTVAGAILTEAGLSFLGLGVSPPTASWGNMLAAARQIISLIERPWQWLAPGLAISLIVLSVNFVGDSLRDALDPRSIQR